MKRGIYRQAALDWHSSPEQLDQVFQTIGPKHWVALVAVALLMVSAMCWGLAGSLAVTVSGPGIVIQRAGRSNILAQVPGLILSMRVGVGDELAPRQVIATLGKPELTGKLNTIQNALAQELNKRDASLRHHAQLQQSEVEQRNIQSHSNDLDRQSSLRIVALQQELAVVEKQLQSEGDIVSPGAGRVDSLNVFPGARVEAGQPVAGFQPSGEKLEVLGYVPFAQATQIRKGLPVLISFPGTGRDGSGRIQGEVLSVSEFAPSSDELLRYLPVGFIKRYLNDPASVVEVRVMLKPAVSASYGSSTSSLDAETAVSAGRTCNIEIVTRQQRPAALVIPYFKKKLGLN